MLPGPAAAAEAMRDDVNDRALARVGTTIDGRFRLVRLVGCGGMAAVYEGVHRNGHRAAIKILHSHLSVESDLHDRFLREGYVANAVGHRGAVQVTDDGTTGDGSVYLVMELLDGETLEARWKHSAAAGGGRQLPLREVCELAGQLLEVLAAAHDKTIVHRDIKPENLFLTKDGVLKVLDFGIARLREASTSASMTREGRMIGTPAFMPPEQALGRSKQIDGQTDLWAVGATMFTLVSGHYVHDVETVAEMLVHAGSRPARSVLTVAPSTPADVADIIDRALAFEKERRWPDARAMRSALAQAYARTFGGELPAPTGRAAVGRIDPYGQTAAAGTTGRVAAEAPALPRAVPPTAAWVPSTPAGPGISTTAGIAQDEGLAPAGSETVSSRGRAARIFGIGLGAVLAVGGGAAVFLGTTRVPSVATESSDAPVSDHPRAPTLDAMSTSPETVVQDSLHEAPATEPSQPPQPDRSKPPPQPTKQPGVKSPKPLGPPPTPPQPSPQIIPATPPPPPPTTTPPAAGPTPSCRTVPVFEPNGDMKFKRVCQ